MISKRFRTIRLVSPLILSAAMILFTRLKARTKNACFHIVGCGGVSRMAVCVVMCCACLAAPLKGMGAHDIDVAAYVDSLTNDNAVYNDQEATRVVDWLDQLKGRVPEDSLRVYAATALLNLNWYIMQGGDWFLCRNLVQKANAVCPDKNEFLKHKIQSAMAGIYLYDKNFDKAGKLLLAANNYFESIGDTAEWLKSSINLGLYYTRTHNKNKALSLYSKVMKMAETPRYRMYYPIVTGYAQKIEEDTIVSLANFQKALKLSLDNGYTPLLASNYNDMARYYYRSENYHECLANARKGFSYAEKLNQTGMKVVSLGIMADAYYAQKNYLDAYRMEAERSKILQKEKENAGSAIFVRLKMADSLVNWVDRNVVMSDASDIRTPSASAGGFGPLDWFLLAVAVSSFGGMSFFYVKSRVACRCEEAPSEVDASIEVHSMQEVEEPQQRATHNSDLMYLHMLAESFNPAIDKVRGMLKEIPKTGDQEADARIRNVITYLLQNRLPDPRTPLVDHIRKMEEEFVSRLGANYPALTKNDLKMAMCIRCGLNARETSVVTGMQPKSVNQARYRLRKSLGLGQEDSLEAFIMSI